MPPSSTRHQLLGSLWMWIVSQAVSVPCLFGDGTVVGHVNTSSFCSRLRTTRSCFLAADMTALANTPGSSPAASCHK